MDTERRVLLAIFLTFLVLYAWQALFVKPVSKPAGGATSTPAAGTTPGRGTASAPGTGPAAVAPQSAPPVPAQTPEAPPPNVATVVGDTGERDIHVETEDVVAVFTNRGARLKSWQLKHYFDRDRHQQEFVDTEIPSQPLPFSLRTPDDGVNGTLNGALYAVSGAPTGVAS